MAVGCPVTVAEGQTSSGDEQADKGGADVTEKTSFFKFKNKRRAKEIAAPVTATTAAGRDLVTTALAAVQVLSEERARQKVEAKATKGRVARAVDTSNEAHFVHIGSYRDGIAASYPGKPGGYGRNFGPWVAIVTIEPAGSGSAVTSELVQWTEHEGVLKNAEEYLWFLDALAAQLASLDQATESSAS